MLVMTVLTNVKEVASSATPPTAASASSVPKLMLLDLMEDALSVSADAVAAVTLGISAFA